MSRSECEHYEQRKAAWVKVHPLATGEEYEAAALRGFRGDQTSCLARLSENRALPAPGEVVNLARRKGRHA